MFGLHNWVCVDLCEESGLPLQENGSLVTNFSDQKLLVTIITNLDTSLQNKKNHWLLK